MTSRERIALAMHHQIPDRVPVMCQLALGHFFLHSGLNPHEIWFTSDGFAEAAVSLQRRYRFDGLLLNLPGRPDNLLDDVVRVDHTADGERLTWRDGSVTFFPWDDNPVFTPADDGRQQRADFAAVDPDDLAFIDDLPGYVWNTYHVASLPGKAKPGPLADVPSYFLNTIDRVRAIVGDEVSVHGEVFSPFTHFMELFGYEHALMNLIMDPEKAHALLDRLSLASVTWAQAQARRGVDAVLISSAFAGAPFASRGIYRDFVVPYERRVTDAVKAEGVAVYTHSCGSIGDRLDLMVETGTMGIDTLDPPPLGDGDLATAKANFGDKLFIKGNMNAVELLGYERAEEVIAHASRCIEIGKPGGGYILSTSCSVSPKMQPWKLELLTPLAEDIGRY
ncbi:MAG: uroporphyrinogen decarboxylase family protein [Anaerolineae bacterium]